VIGRGIDMCCRRNGYPSHRHCVLIGYFFLLLIFPGISSSSNLSAVRSGPVQRLEKGVFLVASRQMTDPRFRETVILITEYSKEGAIGIIVNRPTDIDLSEIFPGIDMLNEHVGNPYIGGPVHPTFMSVLMNSRDTRKDMSPVIDDLYFGPGAGFVVELISGINKDDKLHVYFGYTGWAAGQLEFELHRGDWHMLSADIEGIFDKDPQDIWQEYIELVSGIWL